MAKKKAPDRTAKRTVEIGPVGGVAVLLVVGLVAVAGWSLWRGRTVAPIGEPAPAATTVTAPATWTTPEGDPGMGPENAPVTVVVYSDYQCVNCRQFAVEVLPWLQRTWMAKGLVRVVFRDYAILGPESERAAAAAGCAGDQGRFWVYHDLLFANQAGENTGAFSDDNLQRLAQEAGLDMAAFTACMAAEGTAQRVKAATDYAKAQTFPGTPTYVINGRTTSGAIPVERWQELFTLFEQELGLSPVGTTGPATP